LGISPYSNDICNNKFEQVCGDIILINKILGNYEGGCDIAERRRNEKLKHIRQKSFEF